METKLFNPWKISYTPQERSKKLVQIHLNKIFNNSFNTKIYCMYESSSYWYQVHCNKLHSSNIYETKGNCVKRKFMSAKLRDFIYLLQCE